MVPWLSLLILSTSLLHVIAVIPFGNEKPLGGGAPRFIRYTNTSNTEFLVVAYETSSGPDKQIASALSPDGGNTWTPGVIIVFQPSAVSDLANANLYQLPGGRLVCAFRHHTYQPGQPKIYRIEICYTDDLKMWYFLGTIDAYATTSTVGIWEPFLFQIPGKTDIFCAYAKELQGGEQNIVARSSSDGGKTWGNERIFSHTPGSRDGMPSVATLSDGSLLVVFEGFWAGTWGKFTVNSRRSFDGGLTWTDPQVLHMSPGSKNSGAPWITSISSGRVAAIFMTDEDWTGTQNWPDHASVKVLVGSLQGGNMVWDNLQTVNGPASYWPSSYFWPEHATLYVTYNNVFREAQV